MTVPEKHKAILARKDYKLKCNSEIFSNDEYGILREYGYWLEGLASEAIEPFTDDQRHFVMAVQGKVDPVGPFERLWIKYQKRRAWERDNRNALIKAARATSCILTLEH